MAQTQNLVPDLKSKFILILAVLAVATSGLFERRTRFTLNDGTVITGKVVEEDEQSKLVERASGYQQRLDVARIAKEEYWHFEVDLSLGLDLKGGTSLRYRINLEDVGEDERSSILDQTIGIYNDRLDKLGVKEVSIRGVGEDEIAIELPGVSMEESQAYEQVVMRLGRLEFRIVAQSESGVLNLADEEQRLRDHLKQLTDRGETWGARGVDLAQFDVAGTGGIIYRWFPYTEKSILEQNRQEFPFVMLKLDPAELFAGEDLERTYQTVDSGGRPALGFELKSFRAGAFGDFTEKHEGRQMAIVLDGEVSTAPTLNSRIEDNGVIEGGGALGFTQDEVKELKTVLDSGSLQIKPEKLSKATIGPTLGQASIDRGVLAGLLAGGAVVLFMLAYYMGIGLISCATLVIGMYVLVGGLGFLGATLTLPGIAGIVLTLGMAVDQNILINERIREERAKGKTVAQSVKNGFERAFVTIVDAQVTTFIAGFILFQMGTGPIRGFAATLMLGIATTMFAAIVGSKVAFACCLARGRFSELRMMQMVGETRINFTRYLKPALVFSAVTILGGLVLFGKDYKKLQGLDFAGGFQANVRLAAAAEQPEILRLLAPRFSTVYVVRMSDEDADSAGAASRNFRITIPAADDAAGSGDEQRDQYLAVLQEVLGAQLIPDGIQGVAIAEESGDRSTASFQLNFSAPIDQSVVEGRLKDQMAVSSIEAVPAAAAPAASYKVSASFPVVIPEEQLRTRVATSLLDLPGAVRLSDPIPESQFIGGKVGKELTNSAIKAVALAIICILVYIRIRFRDFAWGLAACVAILHDVLFCLGSIAAFRYLGVNVELDLAMVGAFLTIVGYSLNDTIVIFDRVRENLPRMKASLDEVVNVSVNQTLSRTILTGATTLVAVAILFVMNVGQRNVLEGFAFIMIVGVVIGTYSTVYIASPLLVRLIARAERAKGPPQAVRQTPAATS